MQYEGKAMAEYTVRANGPYFKATEEKHPVRSSQPFQARHNISVLFQCSLIYLSLVAFGWQENIKVDAQP